MGNFDGLTDKGSKYRLVIPYHIMDINYDTALSPKDRDEKLIAIRKVQELLGEASDILMDNNIPTCSVSLGCWKAT